MTAPARYSIDAALLDRVGEYLGSKPYAEVHVLFAALAADLQKLPVTADEEAGERSPAE